jgi:mRNA interferase RelE/StbE
MEKARYRVVFSDVAIKQLKKLDRPIQKAIKTVVDTVLTVHPEYGKPLQYDLKGHRRLRYMDYRIIYQIEFEISEDIVLIVAIGHRKEIYDS